MTPPLISRASTNNVILKFENKFELKDKLEVTYYVVGDVNIETVKYNSKISLPKSILKDGYVFKGWYTQKNGGEKLEDELVIKDDIEIYAQFDFVDYDVTYDLNGGDVINPNSFTIEDEITLNIPTKTGYIFEGWTGSNGTIPQVEVKIEEGSNENKYYIANWNPVIYSITYDLDGGVAINPGTYTVEDEITLNIPTKTGYIFEGWTGSNGTIPQVEVKIEKGSIDDKNYKANYIKKVNEIIGISAVPKSSNYDIWTDLTVDDFIFTLYYSEGQEIETDLTEGVKLNGDSIYTQAIPGDDIIKIEYEKDGKIYEAETSITWIIPNDFFTFNSNTLTITGVTSKYSFITILYIPNEYNGYKVQKVGVDSSQSISNVSNITSLIIEDGVKSLGRYSFRKCNNLISVDMPDSITTFENDVFNGCINLENVRLSNNITSIGNGAFNGCVKISNIDIPKSVTSIGSHAFYRCMSLDNVEIPEGLTNINWSAFDTCSSLTTIKIPEGVTSIMRWAFNGCESLTTIEIPSTLISIGECAFQNCNNLKNIIYNGTSEQFNNIIIENTNECFTKIIPIFK